MTYLGQAVQRLLDNALARIVQSACGLQHANEPAALCLHQLVLAKGATKNRELASSRSSRSTFLSMARAMAILCFWPPLIWMPC